MNSVLSVPLLSSTPFHQQAATEVLTSFLAPNDRLDNDMHLAGIDFPQQLVETKTTNIESEKWTSLFGERLR